MSFFFLNEKKKSFLKWERRSDSFQGAAEETGSHQGCVIYSSREYAGFSCTSYEMSYI